jgi:hypothetical protein
LKEGKTFRKAFRYRSRAQLQEELEKIEIAMELEMIRN